MRFRKANAADLSKDLSQLLDDLKEVLANKGRDADPAASMLFNKASLALEKVRSTSAAAVDGSRAAVQSADVYVHDSPWRAVGGALAVGTLLGFALSRR